MNKIVILSFCLILAFNVFGQETTLVEPLPVKETKVAITLGILQGGGSLLGADFEVMLSNRVSVQAGAGLIGFGGGVNYHLKPTISSSMISLAYWHQGIGTSYTQSMLGPTYVFRARKIFTAQLGLGALLEEGPARPSKLSNTPVMILYSIGIYLPVK